MERITKILAASFGGALGAVARLCFAVFCSDVAIDILVCNILGAFALAITKTLFVRTHSHIEKFLAVGLCGGLSTFPGIFRYSESSFFAGERIESMIFIIANFVLCYLTLEFGKYLAKKLLNIKYTKVKV